MNQRTAILDHLLHHVETITIAGKSYRLRDQAGAKTQNAKPGQAGSQVPGGNTEFDNAWENQPAQGRTASITWAIIKRPMTRT